MNLEANDQRIYFALRNTNKTKEVTQITLIQERSKLSKPNNHSHTLVPLPSSLGAQVVSFTGCQLHITVELNTPTDWV